MANQETIVGSLYSQFVDIVTFLDEKKEPSLRITAEETFRKALLLAAASYFENRICEAIIAFAEDASSGNEGLVEFIKNQAISRRYHTLFEWEKQNANMFFGLFGKAFRDLMKSEVTNDEEFGDAIKAFMEIGRERNRLVHQNYGIFYLEKNTEEIYKLYKTALKFVESIPEKLRQCSASNEDVVEDNIV